MGNALRVETWKVTRHLCMYADVTSTRQKRVGKYLLGRVVGKGASGTVHVGRNTHTNETVAIKVIDASRFRNVSEIDQINDELVYTNQTFYFVMDYASGGSLMSHIQKQPLKRLSEGEARRVFLQIVSALDFCHRRLIVHRDLKPENLLMDSNGDVKIADFGLSAIISPFGASLDVACGTPEFTAPEIIAGKEYDGPAIDLWSLGVILFELIAGRLPFPQSMQNGLYKAICAGVYTPPDFMSPECKSLISRLLTVDPLKRATLLEIRSHPWCNKTGDDDAVAVPSAEDDARLHREANFNDAPASSAEDALTGKYQHLTIRVGNGETSEDKFETTSARNSPHEPKKGTPKAKNHLASTMPNAAASFKHGSPKPSSHTPTHKKHSDFQLPPAQY
eukprot:jgi/Chlat1/9084/Chrsp96S08369